MQDKGTYSGSPHGPRLPNAVVVPVERTLFRGLCSEFRQLCLVEYLAGCNINCHRARADLLLSCKIASSEGLDLQLVAGMPGITPANFAAWPIQSCLCASSPKPAGLLSPPYRYSAIRTQLDNLDRITQQTLLDLYDYNMSLPRSDWSTLSSQRRSSRSLLHHVQRHPLRRQKRDNLVNLPENSPSVDKNDWKIGFVLVRSLDTLCPTHSSLCLAPFDLLDPWPCLSLRKSLINLHWLLLMTDKGRAESFAPYNPAPQILSLSMQAPGAMSMSLPKSRETLSFLRVHQSCSCL